MAKTFAGRIISPGSGWDDPPWESPGFPTSTMTPQANFIDRVREALEDFPAERISQTLVAEKLGTSVRTLQRRLAESHISFRALRRELLRGRAEEMLLEADLPIAEVSYLLGYAEMSNFDRAFRRWTGLSPAAWRNRALGKRTR